MFFYCTAFGGYSKNGSANIYVFNDKITEAKLFSLQEARKQASSIIKDDNYFAICNNKPIVVNILKIKKVNIQYSVNLID